MLTHGKQLRALLAFVAMSLAAPAASANNDRVNVVATFSILGDMVQQIGGDHVNVATLVGRDEDVHVYRPTPAAARTLGDADLLVVNGLGFEGWIDRLIAASDFNGTKVVATAGITPMTYGAHAEHDHEAHDHDSDHAQGHGHGEEHDHGADHGDHGDSDQGYGHHHRPGEPDPHAWHSLDAAVSYVDMITAALVRAAPENAETFYRNRAAYIAEIESLKTQIRAQVEQLADHRRTVVTSHDAFQYFGRDFGLTFVAPQGLSTEAEASSRHVTRLIDRIRSENIQAVFLENITDARLLERIADETGATIGGTLYPGALSAVDGPASTYLQLMHHNADTITNTLANSEDADRQ